MLALILIAVCVTSAAKARREKRTELTTRPHPFRKRTTPLPPSKYPLHQPVKMHLCLWGKQRRIINTIPPQPPIKLVRPLRTTHDNRAVRPRIHVVYTTRLEADVVRRCQIRWFDCIVCCWHYRDVRSRRLGRHDDIPVLREKTGGVPVRGEDYLAGAQCAASCMQDVR